MAVESGAGHGALQAVGGPRVPQVYDGGLGCLPVQVDHSVDPLRHICGRRALEQEILQGELDGISADLVFTIDKEVQYSRLLPHHSDTVSNL